MTKKVLRAIFSYVAVVMLAGVFIICVKTEIVFSAETESKVSAQRDQVYGDYIYDILTDTSGIKYISLTHYKGKETKLVIPDEINGVKVTSISELYCEGKTVREIALGRNINDAAGGNLWGDLEAVYVVGNNAKYAEQDGVLFQKDSSGKFTALVYYPIMRAGNCYTVPDSVKVLKDVFSNTKYLKKVILGASVENINNFGHNSNIEEIIFPKKCKIKTIPDQTFMNMGKLKKVVVPKGITSIGEEAFKYCSRLTEIQLPSTLETIQGYAFYKCNALKQVIIPKRVYYMSGKAFSGCKAKIKKQTYLKKVRTENGYDYAKRVTVKTGKKIKTYSVHEIKNIKLAEKNVKMKKKGKKTLNIKVQIRSKWMTLKTPAAEIVSFDPKVVEVSKKGMIRAKRKGIAKIKVSVYGNKGEIFCRGKISVKK